MNNSREFFERGGGSAPAAEGCERHSDMQSVQNLETVINEVQRVAL